MQGNLGRFLRSRLLTAEQQEQKRIVTVTDESIRTAEVRSKEFSSLGEHAVAGRTRTVTLRLSDFMHFDHYEGQTESDALGYGCFLGGELLEVEPIEQSCQRFKQAEVFDSFDTKGCAD